METINLLPSTQGLIRFLREVYRTDQKTAIRILRAGWPELSYEIAHEILSGSAELKG